MIVYSFFAFQQCPATENNVISSQQYLSAQLKYDSLHILQHSLLNPSSFATPCLRQSYLQLWPLVQNKHPRFLRSPKSWSMTQTSSFFLTSTKREELGIQEKLVGWMSELHFHYDSDIKLWKELVFTLALDASQLLMDKLLVWKHKEVFCWSNKYEDISHIKFNRIFW